MKTLNFRIGNKLLFGNDICDVIEIQQSCFYAENKDGIEFKSTTCEFKPIPLTEELLLKCGFDKNNEYYKKGEFTIDEWDNDFVFKWNDFVIKVDLMYLHTLQNLYHSLTQEELEIKL